MSNYIREQSAKEIIRSTFEIYGRYFPNIFFTYVVLTLPFNVLLQNVAVIEGKKALLIAVLVVYALISILAVAVFTVLVSDICLGNKPSILRSYKRAFGAPLGKVLLTGLLASVIMMIGFLLLIVPGIIFMGWFLFVTPIVIIENTWGIKALKRSKILGKGYYTRNILLYGLFVIPSILLTDVLRIIGTRIAVLLGSVEQWIIEIPLFSLQALYYPLYIILIVLMYYDLRVRKEAYDSTTLAEDLKH